MTDHRLTYRKHTNNTLGMFDVQPTNLCIGCSCGWFGGPVPFEGHVPSERKWAHHAYQRKPHSKRKGTSDDH